MRTATERMLHVMQTLSEDRIDTLTTDALVRAFHDDGLADLPTMAERIIKRLKSDRDLSRCEPYRTDFRLVATLTSPDAARSIVHPEPEIPFMLDGVEYEPGDIRRFNGEAMLFIPAVNPNGSLSLQLLHDGVRPTIARYLEARQLAATIGLITLDFPIPGLPPPTPPGTPPGQNPQPGDWPVLVGCGGSTGIPCGAPSPPATTQPIHSEPVAPVTFSQVQMFSDADYRGDWFWLAVGYLWADLTRVSRGGFFGGDWNDEISSLSSTNTTCFYAEQTNLAGSSLVLSANKPVPNLATIGWNDRISSAWNYGRA